MEEKNSQGRQREGLCEVRGAEVDARVDTRVGEGVDEEIMDEGRIWEISVWRQEQLKIQRQGMAWGKGTVQGQQGKQG